MCRCRHRQAVGQCGQKDFGGGFCLQFTMRWDSQGGRTVHDGAFPSGCIHLPEGLKPASPVVISNVLEHKALEMEVAVRHSGAHKSFPITYLFPVPTMSHFLNPWFLPLHAARETCRGKFGTISDWHHSDPAHSEGGPGKHSCTATSLFVGVGLKKSKLS